MRENRNITALYERLLSHFDKGSDVINKAFVFAQKILEPKERENKHPFIEHPLRVALIVAEQLKLGYESIVAVFLHEATREDHSLVEQNKKDYSEEIIQIVEGLNNISKITPRQTRLQAENYRRLIVSYSKDPRVTLIKLADRLELMQNLGSLSKNKMIEKLTETQLLYIPIAHQLGLYNIKSELENLYFKYSDPQNFRQITNKLLSTQIQRDKLIKEFVKPLEVKLKEKSIRYILKIRTKTAWSIWQKMQKQSVDFEGVYDVFAIRFIIDVEPQREKDICWEVFSLVTQEYKPITSRLRDWITNPKPNGYESLHITVQNREGAYVEVQIRSVRMDQIAENGYASHWSYKGVSEVHALQEWLVKVRELLNNNQIAEYKNTNIKEPDDIFVFTPNGDIRKLPKNASVLDFAFSIHTNIGMTCSGAKINGKVKPIRELLHTGDTVEIMTSKNQKPSPDWLSIVVSQKARSHIKNRLAEEEGKKSRQGREIFERRMKNWKIESNDQIISDLTKHFKKKNSAEFLISIYDESISLQDIKDYLEQSAQESVRKESLHQHKAVEEREKKSRKGNSDYLTIGEKINSIEFKMSKCCNPIYGDDVFGFVTSSGGISIHRITCPNAQRLMTLYPYRIQQIRWKEQTTSSLFQTGIKVIGIGDSLIANTILQTVSDNGASIRTFRIEQRKYSKLEFVVEMEISVQSNAHLDKVISSLKKIKEVSTVLRNFKRA